MKQSHINSESFKQMATSIVFTKVTKIQLCLF